MTPHGCLVAEDGDVIELRPDQLGAIERSAVSTGRIYLDARAASDGVGAIALRDRQLLAETGMLVCLLFVDRKTGDIVRGPELLAKGVAGFDETRVAQARKAAFDALLALQPAQRTDPASVEEALRRGVRSAWKKNVEKRPMVLPIVIEM